MLTLAEVRVEDPLCAVKLRLAGLTLSTGTAGFTVKMADALLLGSAWLVAVTVTVVVPALINVPAAGD